MKKNLTVPESIFSDINYFQYMVQYQGDIENEIQKESGYYVTLINDKYAILAVPKIEIEIDIRRPIFSSIVYVKPSEMYTLQEISPIDAAQVSFVQVNSPLNLTGKGIDVAIIDSGIDYLSDEFMKPNGETRVECIWDQTIISNKQDETNTVPYGTVYRKDEIENAIKTFREGKSPYEIVPSIDEIGHGTKMAGIIGATGINPDLKGVAPDCDFVVVKLLKDYAYEARFHVEVPVFNITSIFTALQFLYEYTLKSNKPIVIYLPLGSNFGNHKGSSILEDFIEFISNSGGIVVVCGSGNQGANGSHASGILSEAGSVGTVELEISPSQKDLWVEIWTELPNIISLDIISPSGENTGIIPFLINSTELYTFTFERTLIRVNFYLPEENSGDELIRIRFYNLQPGLWRFRITANAVISGRYDAWIPAEGITLGETRFLSSEYYGTITNPGSSKFTVTAAAYNQTNNNLLNYSGRAMITDFVDVIDVAAGGVNALTVAPNNQTAIVNGTSVSAAVVAGVCAMLFQWGIIEGNEPYMYSQTVKAYLAKGVSRRKGDLVVNPQWGYGMLNVLRLFENLT